MVNRTLLTLSVGVKKSSVLASRDIRRLWTRVVWGISWFAAQKRWVKGYRDVQTRRELEVRQCKVCLPRRVNEFFEFVLVVVEAGVLLQDGLAEE